MFRTDSSRPVGALNLEEKKPRVRSVRLLPKVRSNRSALKWIPRSVRLVAMCLVTLVGSDDRRNTCLQFTRRSLKT